MLLTYCDVCGKEIKESKRFSTAEPEMACGRSIDTPHGPLAFQMKISVRFAGMERRDMCVGCALKHITAFLT